MSQPANSMIYQNALACKNNEKQYLNGRTCDVFFLFKSKNEQYKEVPAHKVYLSISPVFDAMFYGPAKEKGNIVHIVDSSSEAFTEFLQFFYLSKVKLTTYNVSDVMYLCNKYQLEDCFKACIKLCESSLTLDNVCCTYELAIFFGQKALKMSCEKMIRANPKKVFQSNSFLNCKPNLLYHILQLDSLNCGAAEVFDGCIAWANTACIRQGLDGNQMKNLRMCLGDQFYEIGFNAFTHETFHDRYHLYKGLFTLEEFVDISMMISNKTIQSGKFKCRSFAKSSNTTNGWRRGPIKPVAQLQQVEYLYHDSRTQLYPQYIRKQNYRIFYE